MEAKISALIDAHFANCSSGTLHSCKECCDDRLNQFDAIGAVVINNIEVLPKPQKLFWRYCDDDRAIHPRVYTDLLLCGITAHLTVCLCTLPGLGDIHLEWKWTKSV
jgi:hypothetical protein